MPKSVESVFIFQEGSDGEPNVAAPTYDAIVVEQWTIIDVSQPIFSFFPLSVTVCALTEEAADVQLQNGTVTEFMSKYGIFKASGRGNVNL